VAGIVTEKKAVQGMRFMPGEVLYQVADLSSVWVLADVFEQDIGLVQRAARRRCASTPIPDKVFEGTVSYVYPTLNAETRTVPVRVELANPGGLLKPAMFAEVELPVAAQGPVITVPLSAVIDSGTRRDRPGVQEAKVASSRARSSSARAARLCRSPRGRQGGEPVVVAANFLIDAESNLKAAIGGFAAPSAKSSAPGETRWPRAPGAKAR
jgi:Cu(I)/Ag(I) efflux system membrane fusion protein